MLGRLSKSTPAFLSWPKTNAKDQDMKNDGDGDKSGNENIGDEHTEEETKPLDELPDLRRSTSGTTDLLTSVQEAGSDEHLVRAGPRNIVRLLPATDEPSSTTLSTARPHQPGPETDTTVDYGWGASSLQDHETATNAAPISGATQNPRVDAASQTDQSSRASSSGDDDEDHNIVRAPSWTSQLTHTGLLALANDFNRLSILSTFHHEENGATTAAATMTNRSPTATQGASNHRFGGIEPSVIARTEGPSVIAFSPYRKALNQPIVGGEPGPEVFEFSKQLLIHMDHNKDHLHIDLCRPDNSGEDIYPEHVLAPLPLYRKLRTLTIIGMKTNYQHNIWLTTWLNWDMTELSLEMENEGEAIDMAEIVSACKHARGRPTMMEVARGKTTAAIPNHFPTVKLSLTNFTVPAEFFMCFNPAKLQEVNLRHCKLGNNLHQEIEKLGFGNTKMTVVDSEELVGGFEALEVGRAF